MSPVPTEREISTRRAISADAAGVLLCLSEAFGPFRAQYTPEAYLDTVLSPASLEQRLAQMRIFVATDAAGEVAGTIACADRGNGRGHLRGMAVRPQWQGRGVAEQLLARAEQELRGMGCTRVTLNTTAPLVRAMRFYERHGYQRSGKISDFFGMELTEFEKKL